MDVAYVYPPLFNAFYPMATRIMTENLLRNENLRVEFSDIPVRTFTSNVHKKIYDSIFPGAVSKFSPNIETFMGQKYMVNILFYVFMAHGYFDEYVREDFDQEYVIITCINFYDLIIVKRLLENNRRVLLGGPLINIGLSPTFIRQFLARMGVDRETLSNNLIMVTGNIDLTTDLHGLMKDWKDTTISFNDYTTIHECERDFLQDFYDDSLEIPVHLGFNNSCWYGKCKFCTYKKLPRMDLLANCEETRIAGYIRNVMKRFKSSHIRFIDSYYRTGTAAVHNILSNVNHYDITIYTGIILLKNKEYMNFINRYVNCLLIGLETTSDFSLKSINKGYTYRDIELAVENIIKYLDRKIFLEISVILDLPYRDAEDVRTNYEKILVLKQKLEEAGFPVAVHMNILNIFPNMELLNDRKGLLRTDGSKDDMKFSSGKNYLIHLAKGAGMERPGLLPSHTIMNDTHGARDIQYGYIGEDVPIVRHDVKGNVLPSDLNLMDESTMKEILKRKHKKS